MINISFEIQIQSDLDLVDYKHIQEEVLKLNNKQYLNQFGKSTLVIINTLIEKTFSALSIKDNKQDFLEPLKQLEQTFSDNVDMHKSIFNKSKKDTNFDQILKTNTNNLGFYLEDIYIKIKKQQAILNKQNESLIAFQIQIKKHYDQLIYNIKTLDYIELTNEVKLKKDDLRVSSLNALMCLYEIKLVIETNTNLKQQLENQFLVFFPVIKEYFYRFLDYRKKQNIINAKENIKKSFKDYLETTSQTTNFNDNINQLKISIDNYKKTACFN